LTKYGLKASFLTRKKGSLSMTLTKARIANTIHNRLGFTDTRSGELVDCLLEAIKGTLENGEDILITGFGKFCVKEKRKRRGRNPQTGEDLMLD
jgi:integration host factor subunit alpha